MDLCEKICKFRIFFKLFLNKMKLFRSIRQDITNKTGYYNENWGKNGHWEKKIQGKKGTGKFVPQPPMYEEHKNQGGFLFCKTFAALKMCRTRFSPTLYFGRFFSSDFYRFLKHAVSFPLCCVDFITFVLFVNTLENISLLY